jgi:hypothetical protein
MGRRPTPRAAALVDGLALTTFVVVGVLQHDGGSILRGLVRTGIPLLGAWYLVAFAVGTYRRPGWLSAVLTWAIAVPIGLIVRSVVRGGPWGHGLIVFGGVALGFTLAFVLGGRLLLLAGELVRRSGSSSAASSLNGER